MGFGIAQRWLLLTAGFWAGGAGSLDNPQATAALGRVVVLPGIYNTRFHLRGFVKAAEAALPAGFSVEVRPWGVPFLGLYNLRAEERNLATARQLAEEFAAWRRSNPEASLYVVGYSGGGGLATLMVSALPDDVAVDRLILVAPAIAPDYPLETEVLPRVREFVVNYASARDLQVGWGTRVFGTLDRVKTDSAGAVGFTVSHPRLLQWHWTASARRAGHGGNHLGYLSRRWQAAALLPALDPDIGADVLRRRLDSLTDPADLEDEARR